VFAFFACFENVPQWNCAISETRNETSGRVGVGPRYRQTRTLRTRSDTMSLQASGPLRFVAPLAASRVKEAVAANLGALKEILERRAADLAAANPLHGHRIVIAGGRVSTDAGRGGAAANRRGEPVAACPACPT
jgi:hypothetical protein